MSLFLSLCLLAAPPTPSPVAPLVVAKVVRQGLPPYEDAARIYWLEGPGCRELKPGEALLLERTGSRQTLGELRVIEVLATHALARLAKPGQAFPLRGDLAYPKGPLTKPPALPPVWPIPAAWLSNLNPAAPTGAVPPSPPAQTAVAKAAPANAAPSNAAQAKAAPGNPAPNPAATATAHREPIFFRQGDPELSPGGLSKLKTWASTWGVNGHWILTCPPWPGEAPGLVTERSAALAAALRNLGVAEVEVRSQLAAADTRFPVIFVEMNSW